MTSEDSSLRRLLGRGVAWTSLSAFIGRLGTFTQGVVVARIVAPKEFGVFAIALIVHMVVINVSELGVTVSLIRDDHDHTSRSAPTAATIALASSVFLGCLMLGFAHVFAVTLGSPNATGPIEVMALNLPLAGVTAVSGAILRRDFRMDRLFVSDMGNMLVTFAVVVPLALAGWGALALAWAWVAGQIWTCVVVMSYRPGRFWPGWQTSEARRLLAFGLPLTGAGILSFLTLNVDYIVVGRVMGVETLGFYMLAFNVSGWPYTIFGAVIRSVSLPGFSHLRLDGAAMPEQFLRALRLVAAFTVPICFILGSLGLPLVTAVYGTRWSHSASAIAGLSIMASGRIILELAADYLVTLGRTRSVLIAQVPWLVALATILVLVAPQHKISAVAAVQAIVVSLIMGPVFGALLRRAGVPVKGVLRALAPGVLWGLLAAVATRVISVRIANPYVACVLGGGAGVLVASAPYWRAAVTQGSALLQRRRAGRAPAGAAIEPADTAAQG